jgi:hypothetical protein
VVNEDMDDGWHTRMSSTNGVHANSAAICVSPWTRLVSQVWFKPVCVLFREQHSLTIGVFRSLWPEKLVCMINSGE